MKLGATYSQDRGVEFNVNGETVRGKGAKNDAASAALREAISSGAISNEAVVDSIEKTGYMTNTEKAIAKNYALTIDYDKEQSSTTTNTYHKDVFDRSNLRKYQR